MFYSIRLSRLVATSIAIAIFSFSLAEVRQNPQDLSKSARFTKLERVVKMRFVMGAQQAAQNSIK